MILECTSFMFSKLSQKLSLYIKKGTTILCIHSLPGEICIPTSMQYKVLLIYPAKCNGLLINTVYKLPIMNKIVT